MSANKRRARNGNRRNRNGKYNNKITYVNPGSLVCISNEQRVAEHLNYSEYIRFDSQLEANVFICLSKVLREIETDYYVCANNTCIEYDYSASLPFRFLLSCQPKVVLMEKTNEASALSWKVDFFVGIARDFYLVDFFFVEAKGIPTSDFKIKLSLFEHLLFYKYGNHAYQGLVFVSHQEVKNDFNFPTIHPNNLRDYLYERINCPTASLPFKLNLTEDEQNWMPLVQREVLNLALNGI